MPAWVLLVGSVVITIVMTALLGAVAAFLYTLLYKYRPVSLKNPSLEPLVYTGMTWLVGIPILVVIDYARSYATVFYPLETEFWFVTVVAASAVLGWNTMYAHLTRR